MGKREGQTPDPRSPSLLRLFVSPLTLALVLTPESHLPRPVLGALPFSSLMDLTPVSPHSPPSRLPSPAAQDTAWGEREEDARAHLRILPQTTPPQEEREKTGLGQVCLFPNVLEIRPDCKPQESIFIFPGNKAFLLPQPCYR